jgi:hypothetical protein
MEREAVRGTFAERRNLMKKSIILIITTIIFLAAPAVAGQKEDLAKEMLKLTDMQKMMDQMVAQVQQMLTNQLKLQNIPEKDQEKVLQFQNTLTKKILDAMSWDKMEPEYIKLFSTVYTVEELKAIVDFYKSSAGQSMLKKQPMLIQKSLQIAQAKIQSLLPELKKMTEDFAASVKDKK